jgi:hypothetical protein
MRFYKAFSKITLRVFNFLIQEPERSMKRILNCVYMRFYEGFQRNAARFYFFFVLEPERSIVNDS